VINDGAHIAPNLLISSWLEPNSFHTSPYHVMSYSTIVLVGGVLVLCVLKFQSTQENTCFVCFKLGILMVCRWVFLMCTTLLVSIMLGDNLIAHHKIYQFVFASILWV
jgi:hypothetical protein